MNDWKGFIFNIKTNFSPYSKPSLKIVQCQNPAVNDISCHYGTGALPI
jgi:hypothetical protein